MDTMSIFLTIILPCLLTLGVLTLRPIRSWLEKGVKRAELRSELIEEYHENAMVFLKNSDPVDHEKARAVILSVGTLMMEGTSLIRAVLFAARMLTNTDSEAVSKGSFSMETLSDKARHALGRALGSALLVSSFQSHLFGRVYRSILTLVLRDNDREIREPEQIVYRIGGNKRGWFDNNKPAC